MEELFRKMLFKCSYDSDPFICRSRIRPSTCFYSISRRMAGFSDKVIIKKIHAIGITWLFFYDGIKISLFSI